VGFVPFFFFGAFAVLFACSRVRASSEVLAGFVMLFSLISFEQHPANKFIAGLYKIKFRGGNHRVFHLVIVDPELVITAEDCVPEFIAGLLGEYGDEGSLSTIHHGPQTTAEYNCALFDFPD